METQGLMLCWFSAKIPLNVFEDSAGAGVVAKCDMSITDLLSELVNHGVDLCLSYIMSSICPMTEWDCNDMLSDVSPR